MRIYASARDHINQGTFPIKQPAHYMPGYVPDPLEAGDAFPIIPLFDPENTYGLVDSAATIAQMLTMRTSGVPFVIVNDMDVIAIAHIIDLYLKEVEPYRGTHAEVAEFVGLLMPLYDEILMLMRRVLHKYPDLKAAYQGTRTGFLRVLKDFLAAQNLDLEGYLTRRELGALEAAAAEPVPLATYDPENPPSDYGKFYAG